MFEQDASLALSDTRFLTEGIKAGKSSQGVLFIACLHLFPTSICGG